MVALAVLGGCEPGDGSVDAGQPRWMPGGGGARRELYRRFQSEDPKERMQAALKAGREKDEKTVPYLVDRLTDSEAEIRFAAILALERITGTTRGFRYYASRASRDQAVARWRASLAGSQSSPAASQPAGGPEP